VVGGLGHEAGLGVYNTTKAALIYLTEQLALALSPRIRVNAVAPGVARTRLAEALWKNHKPQVAASTALNRIGEPDDVAAAVGFPDRAELARIYFEQSGRDPQALKYWHVLELWKLAIIAEGVMRRVMDTQENKAAAGTPTAMWIKALVDAARELADAAGI
jgi:Enoyl-(Acyl carrier protein) reductase